MCIDCQDPKHKTDLTAAPVTSRRPLDPAALAFQVEGISPWRKNLSRVVVGKVLGTCNWIARRWLWVVNAINLTLFGLAFGVPVFESWGWEGVATPLMGVCHVLCVQDPTHSFYLNGRQMAFCQRCLAIYAMLGLLGLAFVLVRKRLKPLKFWAFTLLCLPMAVDALTQMWGWRQSTWELRLLTGALFGFACVWYMYPQIEGWMRMLKNWAGQQLRLHRDTVPL